MNGTKTCTRRTKKYGDNGDWFKLGNNIYEFNYVIKLPLGIVAARHFDNEGVSSSEEFIKLWKKIHPKKGFVPDQIVYTHFFRKRIFTKEG